MKGAFDSSTRITGRATRLAASHVHPGSSIVKKILLAAALLAVLPTTALAQEEDAEGCKDSKLLTRMSGCIISDCATKEFDEMTLHFAPKKGETELTEKAFEGATETITFTCSGGKYSGLQIVRNAEGALKKAGFTVLWSGKGNNE